MKDLGLNPHRKGGGWWEEWMGDYRPEDYRGVLQEYMAKEKAKRGLL